MGEPTADIKRKEVEPKSDDHLLLDDLLAEDAEKPGKPADKATEKVETRKLTADEADRGQYLQESMANLLAAWNPFKPSEEAKKDQKKFEEEVKKYQENLEKQRKAILEERERGEFGPATAKALGDYKKWIEQGVVPEAVRTLDSMALPIPPGCPITLPFDRHQRAINPYLYKALGSTDKLKLDLKFDPGRFPTEEEQQRIDDAMAWLEKCHEAVRTAQHQRRDEILTKLIKDNNLPQTWFKWREADPDAWRSSAAEMVDLTLRTRNYIEAMQSLYKDSKYKDFPLEYPPGTKLTVEHNGKTKELTDKELNDPSTRHILANATIKHIFLDLPEDLRQENPANKQKIERMRAWLDKYGAEIDKAIFEIEKIANNPDSVIMFGDQEWPGNWQGRFNAKGDFLGMVAPGTPVRAGEVHKDVNLTGYDFTVEKTPDGKYKVTQTIKAENAPPWAYLNIRALGIEQVGNAMPVETKEYGPEDWVPVKDGDKVQLIKAKNLESFKLNQQIWYYGEKGLIATMDAAMLASGTIELGVAVRGARLAAAAAQPALTLTGRQLAWEVTKHTVRIGVAGSGVFNNAGARDTEWGRAVNTARGLYFLGDISQGLLRGGFRLARGAKAAEQMTGAEKVHTLIHGRKATDSAEAIKGIPYIRQAHTGTHYAFKATEIGFAPIVGKELGHQIGALTEKRRDHLRDAMIQVGDGRGNQKAEKGAFDPAKPEALNAARALLDDYSLTLKDGRKPETQKQVKEIFDETKRLLGPEVPEAEREKYRKQLLERMSFTGEEIKKLELAHPKAGSERNFRLSDENLKDLMDPDKRRKYPKAVRELSEQIMQSKDKDVEAASRVALLYLSRDRDGNIQDQIASISIGVPEYEKEIWVPDGSEAGGHTEKVKVAAREAGATISASETVDYLKRDLESKDKGNRGLVTGDAMLRVGAITHQQFAGILQDVLTDPKSSREDKMRALTDARSARFATVVDGVRHYESLPQDKLTEEEKDRSKGKSFGLSSAALMKTLEQTAKSDGDPDVRAMAGLLLHGLRERDADKRAALLQDYNALWQINEKEPKGTFAAKAREHLREAMNSAVKDAGADANHDQKMAADMQRESKLNAALSLNLLTDPSDRAAQLEITKAIAGSFSTRPDLAERVVRELLPDRMKELSKQDPALANRLREDVIKFLGVPDNQREQAAVLEVMSRMKSLIIDTYPADGDRAKHDALKEKLVGRYKDLLDPQRDTFAAYSPEIRAAAILGLADLGSRDAQTIGLIRRYVSAEPKVKVGNEEISAGEKDARVRSAAVYALKRLGDTELRGMALDLIDKEADPQVAQQLRDIDWELKRIEPDSREYKQKYEETLAKLISLDKYPELKGFDSAKFLDEKFPLLRESTLRARSEAAAKGDLPISRFWNSKWAEAVEEQKIIHALGNERWSQFQQLKELAKGEGEQANKARMALFYLMTNKENYGGTPGLTLDYKGDKWNPDEIGTTWQRQYNHDWREHAARALAECCRPGCGSRDLTAHLIKKALVNEQGLPSHVLSTLIFGFRPEDQTGFKELIKPSTRLDPADRAKQAVDPGYRPQLFALSRQQVGDVIADALQTELDRVPPGVRSEHYQQELIKLLRDMKHHTQHPVLEALAQKAEFPAVKKEAAAVLAELRDSVKTMWDTTTPDTTSNAEQRAAKLKAVLEDKRTDGKTTQTDAEVTVQEIFNAYKGYDLKPGDKGLGYLSMAMSEKNERVKLAAATVIMNSKLPSSDPARQKAIKVIADLSVNGTRDGYRNDAKELLKAVTDDDGKRALAGAYAQMLVDGNGTSKELRALMTAAFPGGSHMHDAGDGRQIRLRSTSAGIVAEELKDGKLARAFLPDGQSYSSVLAADAADAKNSADVRFAAAHELLTKPEHKADDKQKEAAIKQMVQIVADPAVNENLRMQAAKYLGSQKNFSGDAAKSAREQAFKTIVDLAAHGKETKEEARRIVTADRSAALIAMAHTASMLEHAVRGANKPSPEIVVEKLKLMQDLYKPGEPAGEAALYDAVNHAGKLLGSDHSSFKPLIDLLDRTGSEKQSSLSGKTDPRVAAMVRALSSDNATLRASAAWGLLDKGNEKDAVSAEQQEQARVAILDHLKKLTTEAKDLQAANDRQAIAAAWAKVEDLYQRIGGDPNSFAYSYATMMRMAAELGQSHKDLAPIYDRLSRLAADGQDPQQAEFYKRKAAEARGERAASAPTDFPRFDVKDLPQRALGRQPQAAADAPLDKRLADARQLADTALASKDPEQLKKSATDLRALAASLRAQPGVPGTQIATVLANLGRVEMAQGNSRAGEDAWKEAALLFDKAGSELLPEEAASTILGLTKFYQGTGNMQAAEEYRGKLLNVSRLHGTRQIKLTSSDLLMDIADQLTAFNSTKQMADEAERLVQQAVNLRMQQAPPGSVEAAKAQVRMADFYLKPGHPNTDMQKARGLLIAGLQTIEANTGAVGQDFADAQAKLAHCYSMTGDYRSAMAGYGKAMDAMLRAPGAVDQAKFREVQNAYAELLEHTGKRDEAQQLRTNPAMYRQKQNAGAPAGSPTIPLG